MRKRTQATRLIPSKQRSIYTKNIDAQSSKTPELICAVTIYRPPKVIRVIRERKGIGWTEINKLERSNRWSALSPTMHRRDDGVMVVRLESLYWGSRALLQRLTEDRARMVDAERFLS